MTSQDISFIIVKQFLNVIQIVPYGSAFKLVRYPLYNNQSPLIAKETSKIQNVLENCLLFNSFLKKERALTKRKGNMCFDDVIILVITSLEVFNKLNTYNFGEYV